MDDDFGRRPLTSYDEEQRRLIAQFEAARKKREVDEKRDREFLQNHKNFSIMLTANRADSEHLQQLALDIAAKEYAANRLKYEDRLSSLAAVAASKAIEQDDFERKQAIERELQRERQQARQQTGPSLQQKGPATQKPQRERPDYFARYEPRNDRAKPERQPLGKYQALDDTTRQQREESDRRQTPPVEHHRQIEREARDPDYRSTAAEITSDAKRHRLQREDGSPHQRGNTPDQGRNNSGRGGRSR